MTCQPISTIRNTMLTNWTNWDSRNKAGPIFNRRVWSIYKVTEMDSFSNIFTLRKNWSRWSYSRNREKHRWNLGRKIFSWWNANSLKLRKRRTSSSIPILILMDSIRPLELQKWFTSLKNKEKRRYWGNILVMVLVKKVLKHIAISKFRNSTSKQGSLINSINSHPPKRVKIIWHQVQQGHQSLNNLKSTSEFKYQCTVISFSSKLRDTFTSKLEKS